MQDRINSPAGLYLRECGSCSSHPRCLLHGGPLFAPLRRSMISPRKKRPFITRGKPHVPLNKTGLRAGTAISNHLSSNRSCRSTWRAGSLAARSTPHDKLVHTNLFLGELIFFFFSGGLLSLERPGLLAYVHTSTQAHKHTRLSYSLS